MALYRTDIDKAIEHDVQQKRTRNLAQVATLKLEVEQAKNELAKEKGRMSSYLEKMDDLRMMASIQNEH